MAEFNGEGGALVDGAWAKFDRVTGNWMPLPRHLADTAAVAERLHGTWLSGSQRALLAETFGSEPLAAKVAVWLAASHDAGKATVAFAVQAPPCKEHMRRQGFVFPSPDPSSADRRRYPHGLAGQFAVLEHVSQKSGERRTLQARQALAQVVGGHHGTFSEMRKKVDLPVALVLDEAPIWAEARADLLLRADRLAGMSDDDWEAVLSAKITEPVQALLTGFLIVCDWIASDEWLFPYSDPRSSAERTDAALERLGFGGHWRPDPGESSDAYFASRFAIESPRPVQHDAVRLAEGLTEPSLVLVEAPTGEGKTELALAVAEMLAAKFDLHGLMVALPTRATSNAMFGRTLAWLRSADPARDAVTATLAHAKAQFDERFQGLFDGAHGASRTYDDATAGPATVTANQWMRGRKKNVFADFVTGTIDQLLFMTLKAKHLALRHLGLSSKVVIIDEVHAADEFMQSYLLSALRWLGAYGVPVIALSATLPPALRRDLLQAYQQGAKRQLIVPHAPAPEEIVQLAEAREYPLITAVGARTAHQIASERSGRRTDFHLETVPDDELVDAVLRESAAGGCIAVVCNTVARAQQTFAALRSRLGEGSAGNEGVANEKLGGGQFDTELQLFHSRFTVDARNEREQWLIERLGKGADERPKRMIVVATQVVESSLDVDFDLMFTDIAPIDLLVQRIGRVHRHQRSESERPVTMREARVILTGGSGLLARLAPEPAEPPHFDKGVSRVYGDALLLRTVAALRRNGERHGEELLRVPGDVPELIRDTYAEEPEIHRGWDDAQAVAERAREAQTLDRKERSRQFVLASPGVGRIADWSRAALAEASEEQLGAAQVRDAEQALEVVLVRFRSGSVYPMPWLPSEYRDEPVDAIQGMESEFEKRVAQCTVTLPAWMTRGSSLDRVLDALERNGIEAWQRSIWLSGMLPLVLDDDMSAVVNGHRVRYDEEIGLTIERNAAE